MENTAGITYNPMPAYGCDKLCKWIKSLTGNNTVHNINIQILLMIKNMLPIDLESGVIQHWQPTLTTGEDITGRHL